MNKHRSNKITLIFSITLLSLILMGCNIDENYEYSPPPEKPHLYWKTIDVEVVDIVKKRSLNGKNRTCSITVRSEDYDITNTITEHASGMFGGISFWDANIGDIRQATMNSYVMDSTGEVIRREIVDVD